MAMLRECPQCRLHAQVGGRVVSILPGWGPPQVRDGLPVLQAADTQQLGCLRLEVGLEELMPGGADRAWREAMECRPCQDSTVRPVVACGVPLVSAKPVDEDSVLPLTEAARPHGAQSTPRLCAGCDLDHLQVSLLLVVVRDRRAVPPWLGCSAHHLANPRLRLARSLECFPRQPDCP